MKIVVGETEGRRQLCIEGELNIYTALEFKRQLLGHLTQTSVLELDCAHVNEIDTAAVQVLYLTQREARSSCKTLHISTVSPAMQEVLTLYDLTTRFFESDTSETKVHS